jgi:3-methyladenine DNA glycosylase/8-oxoguanine DNA glycosylase
MKTIAIALVLLLTAALLYRAALVHDSDQRDLDRAGVNARRAEAIRESARQTR